MINLVNTAQKLGTTTDVVYATLIITIIVVFYIYSKARDPQAKSRFLWGSITITLLLLTLSGAFVPSESDDQTSWVSQEGRTEWQDSYSFLASEELSTYYDDIKDTSYYDYTHDTITDIANSIVAESNSAEEAAEKTTEYVYENVRYLTSESDDACFEGTAPKILESGVGQCDTQSIVVVSILRRMGIAARPVGGCIVVNPDFRVQALVAQSFAGLTKQPLYTELTEVDSGDATFSRSYSRKGGLHAYVIAWIPEKGWIPIEATTGKLADTRYYNYHVELFPENNQKDLICVSKNWYYAKACQTSNLELLDKYGEGLVSEVSP